MAGFTKLFSGITESSIWVQSDKVLRVWIAMLARADANGTVEGSIPGFANLCMMSADDMREVVAILSGPDPDSRDPDHEGRRIEAFNGGWMVLNYLKYREKTQGREGSRAPYMRAYRQKKREEAFQDEAGGYEREPGEEG